jgi:hypothetical protein
LWFSFFFSLQKITVEKDQTKKRKKEYYVSVFLVTSMPSSLPPPHQPKRRKTIKKPAGRLLSDAYFLSQIFQRPASSSFEILSCRRLLFFFREETTKTICKTYFHPAKHTHWLR